MNCKPSPIMASHWQNDAPRRACIFNIQHETELKNDKLHFHELALGAAPGQTKRLSWPLEPPQVKQNAWAGPWSRPRSLLSFPIGCQPTAVPTFGSKSGFVVSLDCRTSWGSLKMLCPTMPCIKPSLISCWRTTSCARHPDTESSTEMSLHSCKE